MSIEDILLALDEQCRGECQAIFRQAEQEVEKIIEQAGNEAVESRQVKLDKARAQTENETSVIYYSARLRAKNLMVEVKESVFGEVLLKARERVEGLREDPGYPEVFDGLLMEAVGSIGDEGVVHVDPRDEPLVRRILEERGMDMPIIADLACSGGMMVSEADGRVNIVNTFDERLKRVRDRLKMEITHILFGKMEETFPPLAHK